MDSGAVNAHRLLWVDLLDTPGEPPFLTPDWEILVASSLGEAETLLRDPSIMVGVFSLRPDSLEHLPALGRFLQHHGTREWLALVEPDLLWDPRVREILRHWCYDFHSFPLDTPRLEVVLGHAFGMAALLAQSSIPSCGSGEEDPLTGESPSMEQVRRTICKVARVAAPVLITGESGTGKELAARAVHEASPRAGKPFEAINCAAVPASLIQSELFGHERGAFTGAHRTRGGRVQAAHGGTLFLDEIGDLPLEVQASLLRFLQNQTVQRVGSDHEDKVDVRVVAATHVNLTDAVKEGRFREDLFYRLDVLNFEMPPLRERDGDGVLLAHHFFQAFARDRSARVKGFSASALEAIRRHPWPGNVRELINRVRRAMVLCENRFIQPEDLGLEDALENTLPQASLEAVRAEAERKAITRALRTCEGNVSAAARRLNVSRITLYRLARRHDIPLQGQTTVKS